MEKQTLPKTIIAIVAVMAAGVAVTTLTNKKARGGPPSSMTRPGCH